MDQMAQKKISRLKEPAILAARAARLPEAIPNKQIKGLLPVFILAAGSCPFTLLSLDKF